MFTQWLVRLTILMTFCVVSFAQSFCTLHQCFKLKVFNFDICCFITNFYIRFYEIRSRDLIASVRTNTRH